MFGEKKMRRFDRIRYILFLVFLKFASIFFCWNLRAECRFMHDSRKSTKKGARINFLD